MDNITHALAGAAMAECALPNGARPAARRVFLGAGVVAANAPDIDLTYTSLTQPPLGFLLHHRGHSHTLPGLLVLGVLVVAVLRWWPLTRNATAGLSARCVLLIAAALISHLVMDAANSYGAHLLFPFSSRWVFGDAVFVLEPWLWVILGTALALNAERPVWRAAAWLLTGLPLLALAYIGLISWAVLVVLLAAAGTIARLVHSWHPRARSACALAGAMAIFVLLLAVSRIARIEARRAVDGPDGGHVVDLVLDSNPAVPWCWSVLTLERPKNDEPDALIARRGTLSLFPRVWPATSCASSRLLAASGAVATAIDGVVWHLRWRIDLEQLRALHARDCRVRAWLQFARIPFVADGRIADLRYENPLRPNFSAMSISEGTTGCPSNVTNWDLPRRDVITSRRPDASSGSSSRLGR